MGDFLAELRPTVAVFLRFAGIDYDDDRGRRQKLDAFIRCVQAIVERYRGTLIDLNIGDKGSYLYINFGAPIANEDNAARAASSGPGTVRACRANCPSSSHCRSASPRVACAPAPTAGPCTAPMAFSATPSTSPHA